MNLNVNDFFIQHYLDYLMPPEIPAEKKWLTESQLKICNYRLDKETNIYHRQDTGADLIETALSSCFHFYERNEQGQWVRPVYRDDVSYKGLRGTGFLIVTPSAYYAKVRVPSGLGHHVYLNGKSLYPKDFFKNGEYLPFKAEKIKTESTLWQFAQQWNGEPFLCCWFDNHQRPIDFATARLTIDPRQLVVNNSQAPLIRDFSTFFKEAKQ